MKTINNLEVTMFLVRKCENSYTLMPNYIVPTVATHSCDNAQCKSIISSNDVSHQKSSSYRLLIIILAV